ncbi:hypothetical protein AAMO2058_001095300 [Amorphochlora amoebiformis]
MAGRFPALHTALTVFSFFQSSATGKIPVYETEDVDEKTPQYVAPPRDQKQSDDVITTTFKPQLAFERFAGAIYDTATADIGLQIRKLSSDREFFSSEPLKKRSTVFQSPLQRYTQLNNEIDSFLKDLKELADDLKESKDPTNVVSREATDLITKQLLAMKEKLAAIEMDEDQKRLLQTTFPIDGSKLKQKALSNQLASQIEAISERKKKSAAGGTVGGTSGAIQYELYCQPDKETSKLASLSALDRRVAHIEKLIGQQKKVVGTKYPDIHTAVHYLKKRMELLNKAKLDAISNRIKRLLVDLMKLSKAASTAQAPVVAPGAPGGPSIETKESKPRVSNDDGKELPTKEEIINHYAKVNHVYSMLTRYQESANQLPIVIERMKSLRSLHEHTATAMGRLNRLEKMQATMDAVLKQNKTMLKKMEDSFTANMKTMMNNVKILEEKFSKI